MEPVFFIVPRRQAEAKKSVLMFQVMRLSILAMASTKIHLESSWTLKRIIFS